MSTAQNTYPTLTTPEPPATDPSPLARAHRPVRRALAWAVRIGLLAILFVIPLAAYL